MIGNSLQRSVNRPPDNLQRRSNHRLLLTAPMPHSRLSLELDNHHLKHHATILASKVEGVSESGLRPQPEYFLRVASSSAECPGREEKCILHNFYFCFTALGQVGSLEPQFLIERSSGKTLQSRNLSYLNLVTDSYRSD
jgi:hypothetical protein